MNRNMYLIFILFIDSFYSNSYYSINGYIFYIKTNIELTAVYNLRSVCSFALSY